MIDLGLLCIATVQKHKTPVRLSMEELTLLINRDYNLDATVEEVTEAYYNVNGENNIIEQEEDFRVN